MLDILFRRHGLHFFRCERVVCRLDPVLPEVEVEEADQPDIAVDLADADELAGEHGAQVDLALADADSAAVVDAKRAVVEGIHRLVGLVELARRGCIEFAGVGAAEALLRTHLLNIAPVMRMYMMRRGGAGEKPLEIGDLIHGRGVAEVVDSKHPHVEVGSFVQGQIGWQTHKITGFSAQERFRPLTPHGLPIHYALSALGMTGFSAYCGFVSRAEARKGDRVLISGAAGGVGSLVVQMARILGAQSIIGIAGGEHKCAMVRDLGCDEAIDYKQEHVAARIAELFPDGIDLYFDNVGGEILEAALENLAANARVLLCGSISEHQREIPFAPKNYTNLRATNSDMRGFFVYNHAQEFEAAEAEMAEWIRTGKLRSVVDEVEGFENMPDALMGMYTGTSGGKRYVKVVPGPVAVY